MIGIDTLWNLNDEALWDPSLDNYWRSVKPSHLKVEQEMDALDADIIRQMDAEQWYLFLLNKYFYWKYTAPNRYATTTKQLKTYLQLPNGLEGLCRIKEQIFNFDKNDIKKGLNIACKIKGLGTAGGSGLLSVLFPQYFGTVDQFVVASLSKITNLPERSTILSSNSKSLTMGDGDLLIRIMRRKSAELNQHFQTRKWTPRKIDMVLWSINRGN